MGGNTAYTRISTGIESCQLTGATAQRESRGPAVRGRPRGGDAAGGAKLCNELKALPGTRPAIEGSRIYVVRADLMMVEG
ncbi:hypothetical protein EVAR_26980_1 [Eumeta japonica]|uniref:Uncharacterized protein n=1 Tax=Eumeta variegata TaxID=151549 RepID=A0A4C1VMS2_EUMVA|nr:hypothetical protein EVAR_26980_1 [Eumeta japonica]